MPSFPGVPQTISSLFSRSCQGNPAPSPCLSAQTPPFVPESSLSSPSDPIPTQTLSPPLVLVRCSPKSHTLKIDHWFSCCAHPLFCKIKNPCPGVLGALSARLSLLVFPFSSSPVGAALVLPSKPAGPCTAGNPLLSLSLISAAAPGRSGRTREETFSPQQSPTGIISPGTDGFRSIRYLRFSCTGLWPILPGP